MAEWQTCLPAGRPVYRRQARFHYNEVMGCYVYAIASESCKYIYVGLAYDWEGRIARHQAGRERTTKPYRPFRVIYLEECVDRVAARHREKYLKSGAGKEFLKQLV